MNISLDGLPIVPVRGTPDFHAEPVRTGLRGGIVFRFEKTEKTIFYQSIEKDDKGRKILFLGDNQTPIPDGLNVAEYDAAIYLNRKRATALLLKGLAQDKKPTLLFAKTGSPVRYNPG